MDKNLKKVWVKALRSGDYKQGKGNLYKKGRFCCIGVLCDIQGIDWRKELPRVFDRQTTIPPREYDPTGITGDTYDTLGEMNDDKTNKNSFKKIADWIEKNL